MNCVLILFLIIYRSFPLNNDALPQRQERGGGADVEQGSDRQPAKGPVVDESGLIDNIVTSLGLIFSRGTL